MSTVAYGTLQFAEQIAFFRSKRNVLTESYLDVFGEQHNSSFMVAGANRDDLLSDFREAIDKAIQGQSTLEDFRADFDKIVARYGWSFTGGRNWRTRVIFETNLRQSYNAGRWTQLQRLKSVRPFWRYRHNDAVEHPRPLHESWDGQIWHADHEIWLTHFPANGWGCQCYVEALNERDLKRLGKSGPDTPPDPNWQTVTIGQRSPGGPRAVRTPAGIDPGFGYAPGSTASGTPDGAPQSRPPARPPGVGQQARAAQTALTKAARLPASAAARSASSGPFSMSAVTSALDTGYVDWQATVLAARKAQRSSYAVGALEPGLVQRPAADAITPATAPIIARDVELLAFKATPALTLRDLAQLPVMLRSRLAVLLDRAGQRLLYFVATTARRGAGRAVIAVSYELELGANTVRSARPADMAALRADVATGRLELIEGGLD